VGAHRSPQEVKMNKPVCRLSDKNGNVFNLIAVVSKTLKKAGLKQQATEFTSKVMNAGSYDEALQIMMEYVEVK
jgi:hypothetical protein